MSSTAGLGGLLSAYSDSDDSGAEDGSGGAVAAGASHMEMKGGKGQAPNLLGIGDYGGGEEGHHSEEEEDGEIGIGRAVLTDRTPPGVPEVGAAPGGGGRTPPGGAAPQPPAEKSPGDGVGGGVGGSGSVEGGKGGEVGGDDEGDSEGDGGAGSVMSCIPDIFKADLPSPPYDECAPELQETVVKFLDLVARGKSINAEFRKSKGYRNPDFMSQIVDYFGIDELGSNFPKGAFDPHGLPAGDFSDKIAEYQRNQAARKDEERKARSAVAFQPTGGGGAGAGPTAPAPPAALQASIKLAQASAQASVHLQAKLREAAAGKPPPAKRSKWDQ